MQMRSKCNRKRVESGVMGRALGQMEASETCMAVNHMAKARLFPKEACQPGKHLGRGWGAAYLAGRSPEMGNPDAR